MREYRTRAERMQRDDRPGSSPMPMSAERYSSSQRAISNRMSDTHSLETGRPAPTRARSVAGSTPKRRRSSCGMYTRPRSRSSLTSRRKFVSWNPLPRSRARAMASGDSGSSTGSIISPITAAEPSMYTSRSSHVS